MEDGNRFAEEYRRLLEYYRLSPDHAADMLTEILRRVRTARGGSLSGTERNTQQ